MAKSTMGSIWRGITVSSDRERQSDERRKRLHAALDKVLDRREQRARDFNIPGITHTETVSPGGEKQDLIFN
jgi:hypothetical protein